MKITYVLASSCLVALSLTACGTVTSLTNSGRASPLVYGGTRLDVAAINEDSSALSKFESEPPSHPKADLPASLVLDAIFLPGTLVASAFRQLFW